MSRKEMRLKPISIFFQNQGKNVKLESQSLIFMSKIPFNVSARTARLIGRENVSNADGAIIELVKNGYDADSNQVAVVFVGNKDLYIIDNGHGMEDSTIKTTWMTIGTNNKEIDPYSPNRRVRAGAKGIGRFALDRLGKKVEMFTLPKRKKDGFVWSINWDDFEKEGALVSGVNADLKSVKDLDLSTIIPSVYSKNKKLDFSNGGTILKISELRDIWTEDSLQDLYRNMESLVPGVEENLFSITMISSVYPDKFGLVKPLIHEDFDYMVSATYDSKTQSMTVATDRNEFDVLDFEKRFGDVFLDPLMRDFPFNLKTFKEGSFAQTYKITELIKGFTDPNNLLKEVGDFSFVLSFAKNTAPNKEDLKKYPYKNAEYKSRSEWLKKFGGIKIFRDNFRVRPYGENGEDWLKLGERVAQSPGGPGQRLGGYKIRPNQVAGVVNISRVYNLAFQDKSSREGIQENDVFTLFKQLLLGVIGTLEKDRNTIFYSLSEYYKKIDEKEKIKDEAREAIKRISERNKEPKGRKAFSEEEFREDAEKVATAFTVLEEEIEDKHEEIKILRSLASAGLITAAVAHELRGFKNILLVRNKELKKLIEPYIKDSDLKDVKRAFNPYVLLSEMEKTDRDLHEWISYALTPLKRDKRSEKVISLKDYFESLSVMWQHLLVERQIKFLIEDFPDSFKIKGFSIDLDTIFNNLIINSIESFSRKKEVEQREIKISCVKENSLYKISYRDNGAGLDESYKKNPTTIFQPQETTKKNNVGETIGTGMGMYLVKSVIDDNRGRIDIENLEKGFGLTIHLQVYLK
jgi:signal transduction histidine kinase